MKALVMGGNRFFGRRLVSMLIERGVDVTLLNRGQGKDDFGTRVRRIQMDRRQLDKNHPSIKNSDWDIVYDQICYDAGEAESACDAFRGKTQRYIFTSSQSVYPPAANIPEAAFDPVTHKFSAVVDKDKDYGEAKRQAEATFFQRGDFELTAVRFPIVLGEDDYTDRLKFHVQSIAIGKQIFFPNIDAKISFIHAKDAAAFLASLADKPISGPVNACAAGPIRLRDLIWEIERTLGKTAKISNTVGQGDRSPFGIESDWYMDTTKLKRHGFLPQAIQIWLPGLTRTYTE